jgi:Zn finger protein HypA/HybF involved in hydrogenase expression/very-short-patch-repair endonuclease
MNSYEKFIEKSKEKHNNRYDYSLVEYKNNKTKVKIICSKHGVFEQTPNNHLNGNGCPYCGNISSSYNRKMDKKQFILNSIKVHGDKYDYSLVDYKQNKIKIKILCKKCNRIFEQTPNNHISKKHGCPYCSLYKKLTTEQFILRSIKVHGEKYDYSLVDYKNSKTKVKIICNKCNSIFEQIPEKHYHGNGGCPICMPNKKMTKDLFIEKSKEKHNNKYDYSLVEYKNNKTKVKIICPKHGLFFQIPSSHLSNIGCPVCNESKGERYISDFLNKNNIIFERNKKFDNCIYKRNLFFDFYLSEYNICIEFDGRQHYESVDFFGGNKTYKEQKIRDNIKDEYCKDNNIKLIRINDETLNKIDNYLKFYI